MNSLQTRSPVQRQTKYTAAVLEALTVLRHATNGQLLDIIRQVYPEVSATTIHRVTTRLERRGIIARAPKTTTAEERYDIDPIPHHHFMCVSCERLCDVADTEQSRAAVAVLGAMSKRCKFAGMVTLQGTCEDCPESSDQKEGHNDCSKNCC